MKATISGESTAAKSFILSFILITVPFLAQASPPESKQEKQIRVLTESITPELISIRRDIHANPELGLQERRTSAIVADYFRKLSLEVITGIAETGVVGILKGARPGPVVAMRGDMDALPITEETGLPFASRVKTIYEGRETGLMHACGHDIHTTVLMGTANVLSKLRSELSGTVLFIAQPGEECCQGAAKMIEQGIFRHYLPSAIFAYHVDDTLKAGSIGYTSGFASANVDGFVLVIKSEGCHGADPSKCVDPIVVGANIVTALQVMVAREINVHNNTVITVGAFHSGTADNIIPESAVLKATVRTYGEGQRQAVSEKIKRLIANICQAYGASFDLNYDFGLPSMYNDPDLIREILPAAERILGGKAALVEQLPEMGGEDFAYFSKVAPSVMLGLGVVPVDLEKTSVHSPYFIADETSIQVGVKLMANIIANYLDKHKAKKRGTDK